MSVCFVCQREVVGLLPVREFRGNTFHTDLVCDECYERRISHGGTCASCSKYVFNPDLKPICSLSGREIMRGDRCGSYEERRA